MGRWKAIVPVILAIAIAVAGGYWLKKYQEARQPAEEAKKAEAHFVPLTVAAVDIKPGDKLNSEMVKIVDYPQKSLPAGHFKDKKLVENRVVLAALKANEPILEHKLAPEDVKVGGVSVLLKDGRRAIAVKGDKVLGLSGFIRPGNIVDVLVTTTNPNTGKETTKTVLEKILVLATGTQMVQSKEGTSPVDVYTLDVTPDEAEHLALAAAEGRLQFALRNVKDTETVLTKGATLDQTMAAFSPMNPPTDPELKKTIQPAKIQRVKPAKKKFVMEIITAGGIQRKKLDL